MSRKTRFDFKKDRNEAIARAKLEAGLSYSDIQKNPNFNPDGLTVQRLHQIVKDWEKRSEVPNLNERPKQ